MASDILLHGRASGAGKGAEKGAAEKPGDSGTAWMWKWPPVPEIITEIIAVIERDILRSSVADPWHFAVDPDTRIHASD